mgnify:CR=1 FL=1|tara:strand:- start:854 stop:1114 length:261 start_codon:yes stop_codon:yes gene_type:complete
MVTLLATDDFKSVGKPSDLDRGEEVVVQSLALHDHENPVRNEDMYVYDSAKRRGGTGMLSDVSLKQRVHPTPPFLYLARNNNNCLE